MIKNENGQPILEITRQFNVEPAIVFAAFTDPATMRIWWTESTHFDIDLRIGGRWTITRIEGEIQYLATGEYLDVQPPYYLRYSYTMPQFSDQYDEISIEIKPHEHGGSQMIFTQRGPDIAEELLKLSEGQVSQSEEGWNYGFDLMRDAWNNKNSL